LERLQGKAEKRVGEPVRIVTIQEAGLDGFWIHRLLEANGWFYLAGLAAILRPQPAWWRFRAGRSMNKGAPTLALPSGTLRDLHALQPDQPLHVVDQIGEPELGRRPCQADGADEEAHAVFLLGKHVLDMGAHR
jgi:hypothetical protein